MKRSTVDFTDEDHKFHKSRKDGGRPVPFWKTIGEALELLRKKETKK